MESGKIITLITMVVYSVFVGAKDCPEKYEKFTPEHSFCKEPILLCETTMEGVEAAHIPVILAEHNKYRNKIATAKVGDTVALPPAANMMELEWDKELAQIAQAWANQCETHMDCDDCRRVDRFKVGQNMHLEYSKCVTHDCIKQDWINMFKYFYDEQDIFYPDQIKPFRVGESEHFTRIAWANTSKIGCGFVAYQTDETVKTFVCNYGPAGNIQGGIMYEQGEACSKCPSGTACKGMYPGLCKSSCEVAKGRSQPSFASRSASSLPETPTWEGIRWTHMLLFSESSANKP